MASIALIWQGNYGMITMIKLNQNILLGNYSIFLIDYEYNAAVSFVDNFPKYEGIIFLLT